LQVNPQASAVEANLPGAAGDRRFPGQRERVEGETGRRIEASALRLVVRSGSQERDQAAVVEANVTRAAKQAVNAAVEIRLRETVADGEGAQAQGEIRHGESLPCAMKNGWLMFRTSAEVLLTARVLAGVAHREDAVGEPLHLFDT
jgi:hypothetical protein